MNISPADIREVRDLLESLIKHVTEASAPIAARRCAALKRLLAVIDPPDEPMFRTPPELKVVS